MAELAAIPASATPGGSGLAAGGKWMIAVSVALGALMEIVDTSIVNVALTEMQNSLGATLSEIGWVVSSYAIANVIILPLSAWLGIRFGKKNYFVFSLIAFTGASVLCGMSTTLPMLIVARVLQGLGGGGLLAKAQSILFETFPKEQQAMAQGFFGAIVIAGPTIGPTLGGYIVTNIDWRWIFFINVPIGIVAVMLCLANLPADRAEDRRTERVDWLAIGMLAVGLGALQTMLEEGQGEDWFQSGYIVLCGVTAAATLVAFVFRELRAEHPVVDLRVLRHRSLWAGSILSIVVGMSLYGALFAVPIFSQVVMHYTSQQVGILLLPGALTSAFMMPVAANLIRRFDPRKLLTVGGLILVLAVIGLARLSPATGVDDLFWPLIVRAIGTVLMFLPLNMATLGPIPKRDVASASGFFNLTRQLGGSVGVALLTTLLAQRQAFHRVVLVEKVTAAAPEALARLSGIASSFSARGLGLAEAQQRALALLDGNVTLQALVLSFNDTFRATAILILCSLPLVLLLGRPDRGAAVDMGH